MRLNANDDLPEQGCQANRESEKKGEASIGTIRSKSLPNALPVSGFYFGFLQWLMLADLTKGVFSFNLQLFGWFLAHGLLAGFLYYRVRPVFWGYSLFITTLFLTVSFTPLAGSLLRSCIREDALKKSSAVVVLNEGEPINYAINSGTQVRLLHGYELVKHGYAPCLLLTRMPPDEWSNAPLALQQMKDFGLQADVETVGPVFSTHDEAVLCARLARSRNWKRIILVTQPSHSARAAAAFEKAGLEVISSPSVEWEYVPDRPKDPVQKRAAFRDWLYEALRFLIYRSKQWM